MAGKAKIGIVLGAIALGMAVICLFAGGKEGGLQIHYAGIDPDNPNRPHFILTNTSDRPLIIGGEFVHADTNCVPQHNHRIVGRVELIDRHTSIKCYVPNFALGQWVLSTDYQETFRFPGLINMRFRMANLAQSQNWRRLAEWIRPKSDFRRADGPVMLGNEPLAEVKM